MPHVDPAGAARSAANLETLDAAIADCFACPRLVAWREEQARVKVARFRDETYWARPVPGFGDERARIVLVGLAPAAHGGNRTGRVFTGDASGDFLWRAMHAVGLADRPVSRSAGDGLTLHATRVAAAVRCAPPANKPTIAEQATCRPFLVRERGDSACSADRRLVRRRRAPDGGGDPRRELGRRRRSATGRSAGPTACIAPPQEVAASVAREHAARPVSAMGGRREPERAGSEPARRRSPARAGPNTSRRGTGRP